MQLASIFSPTLAELLARSLGDGATFVAAGAAAVGGLLSTLLCPETLPVASRRPFQLQRANPVSGVWVLLRCEFFSPVQMCAHVT